MQKLMLLIGLCAVLGSPGCSLVNSPEDQILDRMTFQAECWNSGDLECFMIPYWQSDSLMFIGSSGVVYGYENTLNRYQKSYPDVAAMGKLSFDVKHVNPITPNAYLVVGKFYLTREIGDLDGWYSLVWRQIDGEWVIISDHTTTSP